VGGPLGVHLFFVLSGFLITVLLLRERDATGVIALRRFADRRVSRLVPALVALFAGLLVVTPLGVGPGLRPVVQTAVAALSFTTNWVFKGDDNPVGALLGPHIHIPPHLFQLWSLAIEAQFYVVWAVALWALTRRRVSYAQLAAITGALVLGVALWRYACFDGQNWLILYLSTSTRLDAPMAGALFGVVYVAGWANRMPVRRLHTLAALGLAACVTCGFTVRWSSPALTEWLYTVLALAGGVAVLGAAHGVGAYTRVLSLQPLAWFGNISYSLYLWHVPIFWTIERHDPPWPGPIRLAVGIGASLLVSWASYRFVEQPFLRRRARPAAPTAAPLAP
jgi:peptidoglycan/LPS O-acetylase OafA/YrhL